MSKVHELQAEYVQKLVFLNFDLERENERLRALLARAYPIIERHAPVSPILADIAKELPDE